MLALSWQYLTGSAVAAQITDHEVPEWPPHPDRVFQALVASWGDRGAAEDERAALEWVERLVPPSIATPPESGDRAAPRKVFVPINDKVSDPTSRTRKERFFPSTLVGDGTCSLVWADADPRDHRPALGRLLSGVSHLGHSSSLVRMWLDDAPPTPSWRPATRGQAAEVQLRVPEDGRLASLVRDFAGGGPNWRRPRTAAWAAYVSNEAESAHTGHQAGRMLVLRRVGGARLADVDTLAATAALRAALLKRATSDLARELLSGHAPDGTPLVRPHVAFLPLPFVGAPHADGHLLGLAVSLPRGAGFDEEEAVMAAIGAALDRETDTVELQLGEYRRTAFALEERPAPPVALRPSTWSRPAMTWASATPLVLGRQAPRRHPDRDGFAVEEIARGCVQAGLPEPVEVRLLGASALEGASAAGDYPPLPTKQGLGRRQVHCWLRFGVPVRGPVVLGAGRFRGYGLFRPYGDEATR